MTDNSKHSPARQALADVGDIAQNANNIVAKIALRCKQPDLAEEVKAVFEQLFVLNTTLTFALSKADTRGLEAEVEDMHTFIARRSLELQHLTDLPERVLNCAPSERREVATAVRSLLFLLAYSDIDVTTLDVVKHPPLKGESVDYEKADPTKEDWHQAGVERNVLLALTRCYRFMIEGSPEMLDARQTNRVKLLRQARTLELKAAISGIET